MKTLTLKNLTHYAGVRDGAIVEFPNSAYYYMKVCTCRGEGGVVNLHTGELLTKVDLEANYLGVNCHVVADNIEEFLREDEN